MFGIHIITNTKLVGDEFEMLYGHEILNLKSIVSNSSIKILYVF